MANNENAPFGLPGLSSVNLPFSSRVFPYLSVFAAFSVFF
jgi:hypothetical protein